MRALYPSFIWEMPVNDRTIFLSFDDGPHPEITPFVLDQLKNYNAKASFFCIGDNIVKYPSVYERIVNEGHATGNHTYNHLNGWNSGTEQYIENVSRTAAYVNSKLFRPPYGKIKRFQARHLQESQGLKIIMWSVLSGDFDQRILPEKCLENVLRNSQSGSIVVFHDSLKAEKNLRHVLPRYLAHFTSEGYRFDVLMD